VQLVVSGPELGLQITPANLADDVDVIEIHQEFYGVPWDAFEQGTPPPPEWVAKMDALATSAKAANKPVFLSVSALNGGRDHLAARTVIKNGKVDSQDNWSARCYDFATAADGASKKAAYLKYVGWMVGRFSPKWLNVMVETNLFFEKCPSAVAGVVAVSNAAYDAVKAAAASTIVFPSIQIDHLYGYSKDTCPDPNGRKACFDAAYAQIAPLKRDRFAMSSYPMGSEIGGAAGVPADWFTRGASRGGERPLIAETGYDSTSIVAQTGQGTCVPAISSSEADAATYFQKVMAAAVDANMDLVNWWSNRDLLVAQFMTDCPCTFDATWCTVLGQFRGPPGDSGVDTQLFGEILLKAFGTMGIRGYDGAPKPILYPLWQKARALPLAP